MDAMQGLGQRWAAYRPTKGSMVWSFAAGAVAVMVIGFAWGGWVTGGGAQQMADKAASNSRDQLVAAVCAERFQVGDDAQARLAELKLLQGYSRGSFIEKGGWATMPDAEKPSNAATRLCADKLIEL